MELVHDAGGLCAYDQANANGILGITRARDAGFDLCQFNLHKTFSSPHGSLGLACGAVGASAEAAGPAVSRSSTDYVISYRINDGQPAQLAAGTPSFGTGAAFTGDVVRLLQSLPEDGDFDVRLSTRKGAAQEEHFELGGLKMVREKVAVPCKWPLAVARPANKWSTGIR